MMKIILVAGARPNFMKIAPLMAAFQARPEITPILVHTGQRYDRAMSNLFFQQLGIPEPDVNLGVGSASHAVQTAEIIRAFEPVVLAEKPDAVLVVGDVNSTIACGLVAVKLGVKLIHVEAGLRSFDRTMPEEINRLLTGAISDLLFCSEQSGVENLRREGVPEEKIHMVGNVMIDTLLKNREKAEQSAILDELGVNGRPYAVVTLHRPSNVDDPAMLGRIMGVLEEIGREMPVIFPVHPRTRAMLENRGTAPLLFSRTWRIDELLGDDAGFHKQFMIHHANPPGQSPFINAAHLIQHDLGILIEAACCALPAGKQYLEGVDLSYRGCDRGNDQPGRMEVHGVDGEDHPRPGLADFGVNGRVQVNQIDVALLHDLSPQPSRSRDSHS
jgi:UDP-N-acetylglucosamine 2-epimerase